jgi:hypothetical protein
MDQKRSRDLPHPVGASGTTITSNGRFYEAGPNLTTALATKQDADADLTALAGLSATAGLVARTGAGAFTQRTLTAADAKIVVTNGTGAAANPTVGLGTVAQSDITGLVAALAAKVNDTGDTITGPLIVNSDILVTVDSGSAFTIRQADTDEIVRVDTTGLSFNIFQGADLVLISDSGATVKTRIDGATGDITTAGAINHDGTTVGFYGATPVTQAAANPDTSGATLPNLEIEVNELKALLRSVGLMAP